LDEGCCKADAPQVTAMITPGIYFVQLFHCSFNNAIGQTTGLLTVDWKLTKVDEIPVGTSISGNIPTSANALYKVKLDGNNALYVFKAELHPPQPVNITIYEVYNSASKVIGHTKNKSKKATASLKIQDTIEYYVRLSFPEAPHTQGTYYLKVEPF